MAMQRSAVKQSENVVQCKYIMFCFKSLVSELSVMRGDSVFKTRMVPHTAYRVASTAIRHFRTARRLIYVVRTGRRTEGTRANLKRPYVRKDGAYV